MRINNNLMAMNTHRQLGIANAASSKSMEKLSSGFRINRAGDDAAGLSISEKMRAQIRGLNMASKNAQDGISLIQTAEGALDEVHSILQRMRELAVQSANDTNVDVDRQAIQDEMDQLAAELNRIAETTQFNGQILLNGDFSGKKFHVGANEDQYVELGIEDMSATKLEVESVEYEAEGKVSGVDDLTFKALVGEGESITVTFNDLDSGDEFKVEEGASGTITVTLGTDDSGDVTTTLDVIKEELAKLGVTIEGSIADEDVKNLGSKNVTIEAADDAKKVTKGIDVSDQGAANRAITTINTAIVTVSRERSKLGAMQNRLEHTIKNLDNAAENLTAAESRIRDVDMAKEMMEQTRQNILQQASTAMLAQANMAPQTVLQLLR